VIPSVSRTVKAGDGHSWKGSVVSDTVKRGCPSVPIVTVQRKELHTQPSCGSWSSEGQTGSRFSEMAGNETGPSNKRAASGNVGGKVSAVSLFAPMDNNRCCGSQQKGMAGYEYGNHTRLWVLHIGYSLM